MRVAICTDMEGLSGIDRVEQCFPSWPAHYRHGVRMLVGDVTAAAAAAVEGGATSLVLADWHYLGRNIPRAAFPDLPIRRLWASGRPHVGPEALGRPDAAVLVGMHAGAGNPEGFLSHTFWMGMSVLLGGTPLSETVLWALALGGAGVPVVTLAGDQRAAEEAADVLAGIPAVSLKGGTSRTSAMLRPPRDAREELAEVVRASLQEPPSPVTRSFPADATIRYGRREHAARAARSGVGERTGERDVTVQLGSVHDLMPFLARGLLATRLGVLPSIAHAVSPQSDGQVARLWATSLRGLGGWAERRAIRAWAAEPADRFPRVGSEES